MNDPHEITVRVQALGGAWETLGTRRYREVVPENVTFSFNAWGPDTCSFVLRRNAGSIHPDLSTWTPIEVEVAGVLVWDGRIKETPTADGDDPTISVQAEGWQYHLDDDVYSYSYIHTRLGDFVDDRSYPSTNLVVNAAFWKVETGDGQILLSVAQGDTAISGGGGVATLDLGPGCSAITVSVDVASSFNAAGITLYVMGTDAPYWNDASRLDFYSAIANNDAGFVSANNVITLSSGTGASIASPRRYIHVMMYWSGGGGVAAADYWFKITGLRAFAPGVGFPASPGGHSIMSSDYVVKHAVAQAAPLLSKDMSQVDGGLFNVPEFALSGAHTPREVINAVNAYENYETKVLIGRRLHFKARPSAPIYEIGEWSGADFQDASANSGDEIFNRVIVQGTGPDGAQMQVDRGSVGPPWKIAPEITNPNPGFEVNTTGWTTVVGTLARSTAQANTGVASASITTDGTGVCTLGYNTSLTGLLVGRTYLMSIAIRRVVANGDYFVFANIQGGPTAPYYFLVDYLAVDLPLNTWTTKQVQFTSLATTMCFGMQVIGTATTLMCYIDDVQFLRSNSTLVDRRNFTRTKILPVSSSITTTSGNRIGDLYLTAHKTTPFKGGFTVVGQGGVRSVVGGATVHPAHIQVGQMVRCAHRIDPDTGGWSRDGTIANVTYNHDSLTSTVTLDENRAGLETLLGRLAVVQGQRRV